MLCQYQNINVINVINVCCKKEFIDQMANYLDMFQICLD